MLWLRTLHRWVGLTAALFLVLLSLSGGALIFKEEIWALYYPELDDDPPGQSALDHAAAFRAIAMAFPGRVTMVRTPVSGLPVYHVYLRDGEALIDATTFEVIDQWAWYQSATGILSELHFHLMAGDIGKTFVGVLGLVAGSMALSGLWLWWPVRRQFRFASFWPAHVSRLHVLRLHRDLGAVAAVFIGLFAFTGAAVVFGDATRSLFNGVLPGQTAEAEVPRRAASHAVPAPAVAMIETAQRQFPSAILRSWSPPAVGSAVHYFRFRQPSEPHPNGRSTVHIDAVNGEVLQRSDATMTSPGDRLANWMYPLHAASLGGWSYRMAALVTALALALMGVTGTWSFFKKRSVRK